MQTLSSKANELKKRFEVGWVRIDQLKQYVNLSVITREEFKLISGLDFIA